MGRLLLVGRLAARDLRHRPGQAVLLLLAITAATAVADPGPGPARRDQPPLPADPGGDQGPDVVAYLAAVVHQPGRQPQPHRRLERTAAR